MKRFAYLGHHVIGLDTSKLGVLKWEIAQRIVWKYFPRIVIPLLQTCFLRTIRQTQPEIVFIEKAPWLSADTINKARCLTSHRLKIAHYNPDEFFGENTSYWIGFFEKAIPFYDVHFIPKPLNRIDYIQRGARTVHVFDRSFDPSLHRPVTLKKEEKIRFCTDVGFIGSWAPYREMVIAELIRRGIQVSVWGNGFNTKGKYWQTIRRNWKGHAQYGEDYVKAICGMKIALHFLRRENRDEQDSRTFEIPACGSFMLAERSAAHTRLFREDLEAVFFESIDELEMKIRYYLQNPERRQCIASEGFSRTRQSPYSHDERLKEFIKVIEDSVALTN